MGQKVHPIGFRLAVNRNWSSRWYADHNEFAGMLADDIRVREYLKKKLRMLLLAVSLLSAPTRTPALRFTPPVQAL